MPKRSLKRRRSKRVRNSRRYRKKGGAFEVSTILCDKDYVKESTKKRFSERHSGAEFDSRTYCKDKGYFQCSQQSFGEDVCTKILD